MATSSVTPIRAGARSQRSRLLPLDQLHYLLDGFRRLLPLSPAIEPHLRGVLSDTLSHPGSLLRAQVAFSLMRRHGVEKARARAAAIAIEYFHTASLIFDDMPSMDDAAQRRGHPCPHRVHGEAAATLGALALITQAYALVWEAIDHLPAASRSQAAKLVSACLGVGGILNGQSYDVHFGQDTDPPDAEDVLQVAEGKTASLVRLSLLLPAWIAELPPRQRHLLDRLSTVWGLSYQIIDDFRDHLLDPVESGKSNHRDALLGRPNLPAVSGASEALERLDGLLTEARAILRELCRGRTSPISAHRQREASGAARLHQDAGAETPWPELESLHQLLCDEAEGLHERLQPRQAAAEACA